MFNLVSPDSFALASKTATASALNLPLKGFLNFERLAALQLNTARSFFEDTITVLRKLTTVTDLKSAANLQLALVKPNLEKAIGYSRSVYALSSEASQEYADLLEAQLAEANKEVLKLLDKLIAEAPAGSEVAVATLKSAVAAANSGYESLQKLLAEVSKAAEARVDASLVVFNKAANDALSALPA